nr:uncharacterized protein LOC113692980 [Coffea arabica]
MEIICNQRQRWTQFNSPAQTTGAAAILLHKQASKQAAEKEKWLITIGNQRDYTDQIIKGIILIMFTAGIDISSVTIEWVFLFAQPSEHEMVQLVKQNLREMRAICWNFSRQGMAHWPYCFELHHCSHHNDHVGGLQVLNNGQWIPVIPDDEKLVVNIGDILQVLSNNRLKSATHRVYRTEGTERDSFAFFYSLKPDKWVEPLPQFTTEVGEPPKYRGFLYDDYMQLRQRDYTDNQPDKYEDIARITYYAINT